MSQEVFQILVMGCSGGPRECDLSGYLVAPIGETDFVALDAGSLLSGIEAIHRKNNLPNYPPKDSHLSAVGDFFVHHIKAYLISHPHLDHIVGLVINSQVDVQKSIFGIDHTIDALVDHLFNNKIWPNYGSEGIEPCLHRYRYIRLQPGKNRPIPHTHLHVESFILSHPGEYPSTAFLIEYKGNYLLYCGDTSCDAIEKKKHLKAIWNRIAPLVQNKKLSGILLECSYPMELADHTAYGHLDPQSLMQEMQHLSEIAGVSLRDFPVVVTHRKESILKGKDEQSMIAQEIVDSDSTGIRWIFPSQGDRILI